MSLMRVPRPITGCSLLHGVRSLEPESSSTEPARSFVNSPEFYSHPQTQPSTSQSNFARNKIGSPIVSLPDMMGKDRPVFDADSEDHRRAFTFFLPNFKAFCIMEDYYWISAERPKAMAALQTPFLQAEWDVVTTTIDSQIDNEDKREPARWLAKLSSRYLGEEPAIQSTHNFLRLLKYDPGMTIQQWHTD